jgi:CcmD family protein
MQTDQPAQNSSAPSKPTPGDRSTQFEAVKGGTQMQSGEKLLVEAYAAIWLITFVFLVSIFRRQRRLDQRIASLEGALEKARAVQDPR